MNFLELCQELRRKTYTSGSGPVSVKTTIAAEIKLVNLIKNADYFIQTEGWKDWKFLWTTWSQSTLNETRLYDPPSDLGTWDLRSFWLDYETDSAIHLTPVSYQEWRDNYRIGTPSTETPSKFTVLPDKSIALYPTPGTTTHTITADYWKTPTKMTENSSQSAIPVRFREVILYKAMADYFESRHDTGRYQAAQVNYIKMLKALEDAELPNRHERMSESYDQQVVVE